MDGKHPNQYDKRPKRRKDKDSPYELFSVGIGTPAQSQSERAARFRA